MSERTAAPSPARSGAIRVLTWSDGESAATLCRLRHRDAHLALDILSGQDSSSSASARCFLAHTPEPRSKIIHRDALLVAGIPLLRVQAAGQQTKQHVPDVHLLSHSLRLLPVDRETITGQMGFMYSLQLSPGVPPAPLDVLGVPVLISCLNDRNGLLLFQRRNWPIPETGSLACPSR
ncbi:unnamed protein product [Pleuronectes platessa]|uniref:Uncharacterized protein n=1 Tax=Pleuronectes platessa TaxID=8262 RepID=A0A9N7YHT7_PLEPL|nr:unnamed protein product [Pleuronectes platessa]